MTDLTLEISEFRADLAYFAKFFERNKEFVPEGGNFLVALDASIRSLHGLDNVNMAKEMMFRGTVTLRVIKQYLEGIMSFELWNTLIHCQRSDSQHSQACQRLQNIIRTNEKLFKYDSQCLSEPKGEPCSEDWNRARHLLNQRVSQMMQRFDRIMKVQTRIYFQQRPAVLGVQMPVQYDREELARIISSVQQNIIREVQARNRYLMDEVGKFMRPDSLTTFRVEMSKDRDRMDQMEEKMRVAVRKAQERIESMLPGRIQSALEASQTYNELMFGAPEPEKPVNLDEIEHRIKSVQDDIDMIFLGVDQMVQMLQEHQAKFADRIDAAEARLADTEKVAGFSEQLATEGMSSADQRLRAIEDEMRRQNERLGEQSGELQQLKAFKNNLISMFASIVMLALMAVLLEALKPAPVRVFLS